MLHNKKILVVVAHPDDEILGIGGTLNKLVSKNQCIIKVIVLGEGLTSRSVERDRDLWNIELQSHKNDITKAKEIINYQSLSVYDFPDNRFDSVPILDIIKVIEKEKETFEPNVIFTHHGGDTNIDHQITFNAVITSCRPIKNELVKSIYTFETPSSTEWQSPNHPNYFRPNVFHELNKENIEAKCKAMECYGFEKREYPHPRSNKSLKILAQSRGSIIGSKYAEAFMLIRSIH